MAKCEAFDPREAPDIDAVAISRRIITKLEKEAQRRNSAYDYFGMNNTARSVDQDSFDLATLVLAERSKRG